MYLLGNQLSLQDEAEKNYVSYVELMTDLRKKEKKTSLQHQQPTAKRLKQENNGKTTNQDKHVKHL